MVAYKYKTIIQLGKRNQFLQENDPSNFYDDRNNNNYGTEVNSKQYNIVLLNLNTRNYTVLMWNLLVVLDIKIRYSNEIINKVVYTV